MEEVWKDIEGFNYQVSNTSKIRNKTTGRILKQSIHHYGYYIVSLNKDNKGYSKSVHRLVAEAFIPNPNNLPQVNHKDENKLNNDISNLEWCDCDYNTNYGTRNDRVSIKMINGKLSKPVLQYDLNGNLIKEWPSVMEVKRQTGYCQSGISACCLGKYKQAYGFVWRFK